MGVSVAIGAAVGAVIGGAAAAIQSGGDFNAIWKGALVGAVGGAVGGWAAPALAPTLGAVGGAMAGGALAGAVAGVGNVALNGGNADAYLKQGLMGAGLGAATGGLMEASGANAAINEAVNGAAATPAPGATPGAEVGTAGITTGEVGTTPVAESLTPSAAPAGTGTEATSGTVFQSTPTQTAPSLNDMYAANATGTMTDIGGSSAIPYQMPGGYEAPATFSDFGGFASSGQSAANNSLQALGLSSGGEGASYAFNPNMSTPSNIGIGGGDYGVTTNTGQVLDSSGNVLGNAPGWETPGTATVRGTADLASGGSDWSMDKLFNWDTAKDLGKGLLMSGGGKGLLGGIMKGAAIPNARNAANQNNQQLMDLYNLQKQGYQQQLGQQAADAARNQQIYEQNKQAFQNNMETQQANRALLNEQQANAAGYNKQLSETYSNPNAYLSSPEAQASRALAMQKLLAQQSAAGRRSAGLGIQNQLMMNQLSNLGQYRQGLNSAIRYPGYLGGMSGMSYAPQTQANATGLLSTMNAAQQWNPDFQTAAGLSSIFY